MALKLTSKKELKHIALSLTQLSINLLQKYKYCSLLINFATL